MATFANQAILGAVAAKIVVFDGSSNHHWAPLSSTHPPLACGTNHLLSPTIGFDSHHWPPVLTTCLWQNAGIFV